MNMDKFNIDNIIGQFVIYGELINVSRFGNGLINDTFRSTWNQAGSIVRYTHQRINRRVFIHPDKVMSNIMRVTGHITEKNRSAGVTDWNRRCLTVVPSRDGNPWVRDDEGNWWRTYLFIEDSYTKDTTSSPPEARFLGAGIGFFHKQLADLPPPRLHDTIPDFHNMIKRYLGFYRALKENPCDRIKNSQAEIDFMRVNEERGAVLINALLEGRIPERICHNDTKMNNILIDNKDSGALCVIDLDTVMPGTILFDLGDLIRTVTNRAAEDELDLSKVNFDIAFLKELLEGYLCETKGFLIPQETALLLESGRNITQIMALRFLTDYLEGDHYYRTSRPEHNLDRCRTQIAMIKSMDSKWDAALEVINKLILNLN